jgi:HEAT repeat protein
MVAKFLWVAGELHNRAGTLTQVGCFADTLNMIYKRAIPYSLSALAASLAVSAAVSAQPTTQELDAAAPMLEQFYEGVPYERAIELDELAIAGLIAVIEDPDRIDQHPNALVALGMNGHPDAFAVIADYADRGVSGELDRAEFRALRAVPFAMGHLARVDRDALRWLVRAVDVRGPGRRFAHMDSNRVERMMRRAAMTGLALSGHPRAERVLKRKARSRKPVVRRHALEALEEHARIADFGAAVVLSSGERDVQ